MGSIVVSVVVPVYNVELYLEECVESVLKQDYFHWELLLVDDGSTDASGKLCDELSLRDKRIKVFHKINGGLSSARNLGLDKAKGKYVIFLDSDDYWLTNVCLSNLLQAAENFDADVVRGEYKEVDEYGNDLLVKDFSKKADKKLCLLSSSIFYKYIVGRENFSVLFLFRRAILDSTLRFDEARCFEEDVELNIRLFSKNLRCVYIPDIFYAYRKRSYSIVTTSNINHLRDSFLLSDIFEKYSHIVNDYELQEFYQENAVLMYYWTLVTIAEDPYYHERIRIIKQLKLSQRRKKILSWAHKYKIIRKSYIFNVLPPNISLFLFRIRNKCFLHV